jgi:hypothetical protein
MRRLCSPSAGTRHSILTTLGQELPERVLHDFSRHKDSRSLERDSKPRATQGALVRALAVATARGIAPRFAGLEHRPETVAAVAGETPGPCGQGDDTSACGRPLS